VIARIAGWGIHQKLLTAFVTLILLPVFALAAFSYLIASRTIEEKANRYSHDILFQTTKTMESRLKKIEDVSLNVILNEDLQSLLPEVNRGRLSEFERARIQTTIQGVLASQVLFQDEVNAIFVVSNSGNVFSLDKTKQHYGLLEGKEAAITAALGGVVWLGDLDDPSVVTLARTVNSVRTQRQLGYLLVYVDERFLFEVIANTQSVLGGRIMLVDAAGRIVSAADKGALGQLAPIHNDQTTSRAYTFETLEIDDEQQYAALSEPMSNGWRVAAFVPVDVYQSEVVSLRNTILIAAAIIGLLALVTAWDISTSLSKPIHQLSADMRRFGEGELEMRSTLRRGDEIGQLGEAFNNMADNINSLVERVYDEQATKREIEIRSLRMQINPHFLYNTLETINWMARSEGADGIGVMVKSLGDLMRATIDSKDFVPLDEEVGKLRHYLTIQGYRYGDGFHTVFDLDTSTGKLYVPSLLLQPLVENALIHGIGATLEPGTLTISAKLVQNTLILEVGDDGAGMSAERMREVLRPNQAGKAESSYSIGLPNVIRRIHTLFGDCYGLDIISELGEGTTVTLRLPPLDQDPTTA
jgi:two-component system sensor histidine kinase YesM